MSSKNKYTFIDREKPGSLLFLYGPKSSGKTIRFFIALSDRPKNSDNF